MAVDCVLCKMFCAIFLIICTFTKVYSSEDISFVAHSTVGHPLNYFYYKIEPPHLIQKRRAISPEPAPPKTTTSSPTALTNTSTSPPPEKNPLPKVVLTKNLGVNGTGIRKNTTKEERVLSVTPAVNLTALSTTVAPNVSESVSIHPKANIDDDNDDDLGYPNLYDDDNYNKTLSENNITKTIYDAHQFYNSTLTEDPAIGHTYWVDMTKANFSEQLSQSHRRAATVKLSFEFPFYGHLIRNITIATGGFLYTGEYVHSWLAATQYIAPLMANFDTSLSNDSYIKFLDNGTSFTVQWINVALQDKPDGGNFTFQTTLFKNGDIVFLYENIPFAIEDIQDDHHPVKVGLSDAYISDRTIFFVRRKTIYEYHRVIFNHQDIKNWTSIYLTALPTCLSNKDCVSCVTKQPGDFICTWCPATSRCSSGMDRNRQDWLSRSCERKKIQLESMCLNASFIDIDSGVDMSNSSGSLPHYKTSDHTNSPPVDQPVQQPRVTTSEKTVPMGVSSIMTILLLVSVVVGSGVWVMYAYRNPHSTSGQILIRYRPSQWSWKRGEARYTAATIHM